MTKAIVSLTCVWFVFLSVAIVSHPELIGKWQARAELAFLEEADRIGLWDE